MISNQKGPANTPDYAQVSGSGAAADVSCSPSVALVLALMTAAAVAISQMGALSSMEFTSEGRTSPSFALQALLLSSFLATAVYQDLRFRKIPNRLNLIAFVLFALFAIGGGLPGPAWSDRALAASLVFGAFLLAHIVGIFGAGDVKASAVLGFAWGTDRAFDGVVFSLLAGGAIALVIVLTSRYYRTLAVTSLGRLSPRIAAALTGMQQGSGTTDVVKPRGVPFAVAFAIAAIFV